MFSTPVVQFAQDNLVINSPFFASENATLSLNVYISAYISFTLDINAFDKLYLNMMTCLVF